MAVPGPRFFTDTLTAQAAQRETVVRSDMRASLADGAGFSVMVGFGETYLAAFALAVGLGEVVAGLMATLPLLLGATLQLISPYAVRRLGSVRRWVVGCAVVQATSLLPIAWAGLRGEISAPVLMLIATVYWAAGLGTGPAWNTWIGRIIPARVRAPFLAKRSRLCQVAVLLALIAGGVTLHVGAERGRALAVFAALFALAALSRYFSSLMLWKQSEPRTFGREHRLIPLRELPGRLRSGADGRLLVYMLGVQTAVQISGPFFTPYMLERLEFSYLEYLSTIAVAFVSKIIALPALGRWASRLGAGAVLWTGGVAIVPLSALWIVSDSLWYLLAVQVCSGAAWAMYELGTMLLLIDRIPEHERTSLLTLFNFANALAMVVGSVAGGIILWSLGETQQTYHLLFGLSMVGRIVSLMALRAVVADVERPLRFSMRRLVTRVIAVRPQMGSLDRPVFVNGGDNGHDLPTDPVADR